MTETAKVLDYRIQSKQSSANNSDINIQPHAACDEQTAQDTTRDAEVVT